MVWGLTSFDPRHPKIKLDHITNNFPDSFRMSETARGRV
jgi:hypothetical protein